MGYIGFTERGDAGIDLRWKDKLENTNNIDGAVLITKRITDKFIKTVLDLSKPVVVHANCTGWGGTAIEPGAAPYSEQLQMLNKLIELGFDVNRCVIRIDPIIPTSEGLSRLGAVLNAIPNYKYFDLDKMRIRFSVLDMYPHVKERFKKIQRDIRETVPYGYDASLFPQGQTNPPTMVGFDDPYHGKFYASQEQFVSVYDVLKEYAPSDRAHLYETCAEPAMIAIDEQQDKQILKATGCLSEADYTAMNLTKPNISAVNGQNRHGCLCLRTKTELFPARPIHGCALKCAYCYWK